LPETATVGSGGGEGHFHFYYRRPKETPLININKAGEYDIQPRGYVVAAGSLHQSGRTYQWITDYQWRDVEDLPDAPDWVLAEIQLKWGSHIAAPEVDVDFTAVELRPGLVGGTLEEWWNGDRCAAHDDGSTDRSLTLFIIGKLMAKRGATAEEIVAGLRDRDEELGLLKYSRRKDGGVKEYSAIAQAISTPASDLSWEEVQAAVGADPADIVDGQRWDAAPDQQPFDGAGTGRRRFTGTKGAEVRQTRDRHGKIWLEAHRRLGDTDAITRANQCGGLYGQVCDEGHITAAAEKERLNCKQRLHPRCLGTNARKAFYISKTRGPTKLDNDGDIDISIVQLGRFDVGEDPFEWSPNVHRQMEFVREHNRKLRRRKDAPQSFKHSFLGWRVDLRKGCLTLDVLFTGARDRDLPGWLKESFAEVASESVRVETLNPRTSQEVISDFGNLMSSAVAYSDVDECLALLEALKGWHLVQPQGKYLKNPTRAEEKCNETSIGDPHDDPIEVSLHPDSGATAGSTPHPPCPECGKPTRPAGFRTGRWEKAIGRWSKHLTWMLRADDADPGGGPGEGFEDFQKDVTQAREEHLVQGSEEMVI
jgi:hypothetical protein